MTNFRWIAPLGGEIVLLQSEPLVIDVKRGSYGAPLMSFVLVPPDVGKTCSDIMLSCSAIVRTEEDVAKSVSCTAVPWKTVESLFAAVVEFVEKFSDDPVCAVMADALRLGLQEHEVQWSGSITCTMTDHQFDWHTEDEDVAPLIMDRRNRRDVPT